MNLLQLTVALLTVAPCIFCARILAVFPIASYSHQIVYQPIWRELSLRGHQVTVITTDPLNDPTLTNLTEISWKSSYQAYRNLTRRFTEPVGVMKLMEEFRNHIVMALDMQLSHPEVRDIIQSKEERFDLVIVEWLITAMAAFGERFDCPLIGLSSLGTTTTGHDAVGNPSHPAYNPDLFLPFQGDLTLLQRIGSTLFTIWTRYNDRFVMTPKIDTVLRKHFGEDVSSLAKLPKRISLLLLNVNAVFYPIRPNVPAVVELGGIGIHMRRPKPLPEDLQRYLDASKQGVIYFSLGSNIQSSVMTPEKLQIITEALGELPYNVLWKWETDELPHQPPNVKIAKWLPQQDILAHPNIKLFITQGGLQSLEEALHYKIPCLGMPFLTEQYYNLAGAEKHGFAKKIEFKTLTKQEFKEAILEIISNPEYKTKATLASELVSDEPMKALDKAIWWIEYAIRHKGAPHLRSPAVDMPWYQYLLLDVFGVLLAVLLLGIYVVYKVIRVMFRLSAYVGSRVQTKWIIKKTQ